MPRGGNSRIKVDDNAPKATQDCKVCNRRRIKCDRALPTCGKCRGRNLECPGYGLVLKWGQGVASRGKLAGKSYPIRNPDHVVANMNKENTNISVTTPPKSTTTSPKPKVHKREASFKHQTAPILKQQPVFSNVNIVRVDLATQPDVDADFEEDDDHLGGGCCGGGPIGNAGSWDDWLVQNGAALNLPPTTSTGLEFYDTKPTMVPSPPSSVYSMDYTPPLPDFDFGYDLTSQLPSILQNTSVRDLIAHYDQTLAGLMVWIDTPSNPWRKIMIPLAMQSPTLLLALLAVSANHLSAQNGGNHPVYSPAATRYRDSSLALITSRLKLETQTLGYQSPDPTYQIRDKMDSDATLAAIIMLTNFEMIGSQTNAWRTHLDAARTMIKLRGGATQIAAEDDQTSGFLLSQFFVIDVLASTTTFSTDDAKDFEMPMNSPPSGREELFEDFLKVMHQITRWERQLSNPQRTPPSIPPPEAIQARFEGARQRTVRASAAFASVLSVEQKDDFDHLINVYHHSGLLYAWRSLYNFPSTHNLITTSKRELYSSLHSIKDQKRFAVDLVYPLFILGTESIGDVNTQQYVQWRMKEAMDVTGFSNCLAALTFLDSYWSEAAVKESWVSFARKYGDQGHQFLLY
ncbi:hypothetical protein TWF694_002234 [Orbilia ellipsospora]|uniref:Zn(2)-C6 fungal-type domain-containing protein n=1 Tax=Orbilia ellipsospora TaxID=2528407 RepID=A0AAV9X2M8_9PEZI